MKQGGKWCGGSVQMGGIAGGAKKSGSGEFGGTSITMQTKSVGLRV